jgi:xylose isomerase
MRHFDSHAYRSEDAAGVKEFAKGSMRSYLIYKEKAQRWNADKDIQALVAEIGNVPTAGLPTVGPYAPELAAALKGYSFDRAALGARGLGYEKLDQLTIEVLLGVR